MADFRDTIVELTRRGVLTDAQAGAILGHAAERFSKFELVEKIGEGGMGAVWKAWQKDLGRWVALKFIKGDDPEDLARFIREAQIAAKLSHPNIVATYEAGEHDGKHFIAMEYIEGSDLKKLRVPAKRALELIRDAANAVHFAHENAIIHRDLKPQNLMLSKTDRLYVMDFGLARSLAAPSGISISGTIVGTPSYMSPEQARGEKADARSDVYSLGATLYELVTGQLPFEGENVLDVLNKVTNEEPAPPRTGADVATIVMKCLEKDPARRYATARELADDLGRELSGDPIAARPASMAYRIYKRVTKQPVLYALWGLLAVSIFGGSAFGIVQLVAKQRETQKALDAEKAKSREQERQALIERATASILEAEQLLPDPTIKLEDIQSKLHATIADLESGLKKFPKDAKLCFWLGRANDLLWKDDAAIGWYTRAVESDPKGSRAFFYRAQARLREYFVALYRNEPDIENERSALLERVWDDLGKAAQDIITGSELQRVDWYKRLSPHQDPAKLKHDLLSRVKQGGRTEEAYFLLGVRAQADGDLKASVDYLNEALKLSPRHVSALFARAGAKGKLGDDRGQLEDCTRAIALKADFAEAYINRGVAKTGLRDDPGAVEDFTKALGLKPDSTEALLNRAVSRERLADLRGAIQDCSDAIHLKGNDARAYYIRAWARDLSKDPQGAIADYTKAIERNGTYAEAYLNRGEIKGRLGDFRGEIEDCTEAIKWKKDFAVAYFDRGLAKGKLGDARGEIEDCTEAIKWKSDFADAYNSRGAAKGMLGDDKAAAEDFAKALEVAPPDWPMREAVSKNLEGARRRAAGQDY